MSKNSYKAQLNYYDSKWGWKSEGTASQGQWDGTGVRTGVLYFPGLAALKGKIINSVKLTATTGQTGYGTATTKPLSINSKPFLADKAICSGISLLPISILAPSKRIYCSKSR